ncbi:chromate resistance protein [Cognatishimia sp. SS12]|uniref:chromate resistance protein ChrB domain-containing protein n=1 Tax=Cognatishimia sp. SS12 TaxID=2979465 RepID=UPI00232C1703|nr:chromate resistance protein ChrB domain-containing protein [Cognatishimia sp. SS12]MDC0737231.1 chromate resistance protein [Cognatishimia sp. SS12]
MPALNEISPAQLMRRIGVPDAPALIDVRLPEDVAEIPSRVPTALPFAHEDLDGIIAAIGTRAAVVICHKGRKLSHGVRARLQARGMSAEVLSGGSVAWQEAALPAVPDAALREAGPLWVTRHRPKIDRIACPWLIRRFVDPAAEFLFVPPAEVADVAARFGATMFDMPGGDWGHEGSGCSFDTMCRRFGLRDPALARLATVVRAADTGAHDLAPEAAGLLAISAGLSRQYRDDNAQLAAGLPIYDALYRWARDAFDETHADRPAPSGPRQP